MKKRKHGTAKAGPRHGISTLSPLGRGARDVAQWHKTRYHLLPTDLANAQATLQTNASHLTKGIARSEYEYTIPLADASVLLDQLCPQPQIEKKRYAIRHCGNIWEVDEFFGDNKGLIVAEIELEREDQAFERPDWIGAEVTSDPRYSNAALCAAPFNTWR